jgi:hypothetical protein
VPKDVGVALGTSTDIRHADCFAITTAVEDLAARSDRAARSISLLAGQNLQALMLASVTRDVW